MSEDQRPEFKSGSKAALFLELANPDKLGFSRIVSTEEFVDKYNKTTIWKRWRLDSKEQ